MIYSRLLLVFLILSSGILSGQSYKLELQPGIGFYSMSDLKHINNDVSLQIPFNTKLVSDFPAYWYLRPAFSIQYNKFSLGLTYSLQSTGSRLSAKDYSGEYRFDMNIKSNSPGICSEVLLRTFHKIRINLYSILGVSFSKLRLHESFTLLDQNLTDEFYKYKAYNYYVEPGFNFTYPIRFLNVGIYAGYLLQLGEQAFYTDNDKNKKLYASGSTVPIKPDWKGLRFGATIYYSFGRGAN